MSDNVSPLIGVLVDVSGSMRTNAGDQNEEKPGKWIDSVFQVIDDLIKYDVSDSNHMFAVGFGFNSGNGIVDMMSTLKRFQNTFTDHNNDMSYNQVIERILKILENAGAVRVRKWAKIDVIKSVASEKLIRVMLRQLQTNNAFVKASVDDFLPKVCKEGIKGKEVGYLATIPAFFMGGPVLALATGFGVYKAESAVAAMRPATTDEIEEVVQKAKRFLLDRVSVYSSFFSVQEAHKIVHGCADDKELSDKRKQDMLNTIEPFIFGRTPMFTALNDIVKLFCHYKYRDHKKLLFILSDGLPTDTGSRDQFVSKMTKEDVSVVSCFITSSDYVTPKRLYSETRREWDDGGKFLFSLSSVITTQLLPRTIFIKRGWQIDITNNETRLFLHINHPEHVKDACDLARNVVCCQDSLVDLLSSVSLDIYINQYTGTFPAHNQVGGTCYANASAAVLHLSMKRVIGRTNGYPDFMELRQDLIRRYGEDGANTFSVLQSVCPQYRLRCQKVDNMGALRAVTAKRPVVATFRLTDGEWDIFSAFYEHNKTGILSKKEIDINKRSQKEELFGHAVVVLTSFNSECLRFMNSWGTEWGDEGFFRVQKADVLDFKFVDVFWIEDDLYHEEKNYYATHGSEVASSLIRDLKGLQVARYQCPLCGVTSLVTDFTGSLLRAKCPRCLREFRSDEAGNILALNIYLTSLSR